MEMNAVYVETSIVSYLTGRPSRDLVIAARQQETREWWENSRDNFDVFISQRVLDEAGEGNATLAEARLSAIRELPILDLTENVFDLTEHLIGTNTVPKEYPDDAVHIAVAAVHGIDYILTWNFKHLNNAIRKTSIEKQVRAFGYECPVICTPEELTKD